MLPYPRGLILDTSNNIGIVKTETVFGFSPSQNVNRSSNEALEWIITRGNFAPRSLQVSNSEDSRALKSSPKLKPQRTKTSKKKHIKTGNRKGKGKGKKCVIKMIRKEKKNKRGTKFSKMQKKYMMPLILGLLAAKSLLIPIALKALAFISAKGLMMGFFSTVMASVLSLKGMFDHQHSYQNRKDDAKTQVEIIQVPSKSEDHVYYDEHYKRGDLLPVMNGEFKRGDYLPVINSVNRIA